MAGADVTSAAAGAQCPHSEAVVSIYAGPRLRGVAVVSGSTALRAIYHHRATDRAGTGPQN